MEHFNSETVAIYLLAAFSGLSLFKHGLNSLQAMRKRAEKQK